MNKRTKKKVKKIAKKTGKKIIKSAKKNPKKFAISVFIILLISAIVIGYLYFFGPLKEYINAFLGQTSSEPISSQSSPTQGDYTIESVMNSYKEDSEDPLDPDNGGLTTTDIDEITSTINSYYASVDNSYKGETLWTTLYTLTEPEELVSYGELRYIEKGNPYADQSPADESKMIDFYTGIHYPSEWAGGKTWQRKTLMN